MSPIFQTKSLLHVYAAPKLLTPTPLFLLVYREMLQGTDTQGLSPPGVTTEHTTAC